MDKTREEIWKEIFEAQERLAEKFHAIEVENGLRPHSRLSIELSDAENQLLIKNHAYRVYEEITEFLEVYEELHHMNVPGNRNTPVFNYPDLEKYKYQYQEELADVIHFFVEYLLIVGISSSEFVAVINNMEIEKVDESLAQNKTITFLKIFGLTNHLLNNKPWKKNLDKVVDEEKFLNMLYKSIKAFMLLCLSIFDNEQNIYNVYFKKEKINQKRIKDGV